MHVANDELGPNDVSLRERIRRLPEAILLTAGYYAGRSPLLRNLLRRPH
jgi:hypothetical protein